MPLPKLPLRRLYGDICRGYSRATWRGHEVYVKHLGHEEHALIDDYTEAQLAHAQSIGVSTREQKEEWLIESNQWSQKQEMEIIRQKGYIEGLLKSKATLKYESQMKSMNEQIATERARLDTMTAKKERLFGYTADQYAAEKAQFEHVRLSFCRDATLTDQFFTKDDLGAMDEKESYELLDLYVQFVMDFTQDNVKRVSIAPFVSSALSLCGEDLSRLFAKPIWQLSVYQSNLLIFGSHFRSIMQGEKIPPDILDDPQKIEEYVVKAQNVKDMKAKMSDNGGNVGVFGATQKDMKEAGLNQDQSLMKGQNTSLLSTLRATIPAK